MNVELIEEEPSYWISIQCNSWRHSLEFWDCVA